MPVLAPGTVSFIVYGVPVPKGSKRAFVVKGRPILTESAGGKLKDWARRVEEVVQREAAGMPAMLTGPLGVVVDFAMPRPTSVPKRAIWHAKRPDLDKLLRDRKSTRLNSSHLVISYAVFCLKKKKITRYAKYKKKTQNKKQKK